MPSMKHDCGKRYTQVRRMGKFIGLFCSQCGVFAGKRQSIRSGMGYRDMRKGVKSA